MSVIKSLKKSNLILIVIIVILLMSITILLISNNTKKVIISSEDVSKENIISSNAITMMYETDYQSGEYQVSSDSLWPQDGYTFNETLSKCENGGILTWDDENKSVLLQTNTSDKCFVYFDKEPDIIYLADYIINNVYTGTDGDNGLYYHDGVGTYANADQEAGDNSYRYSGADPNNYVCFGSDASTCPYDNIYRIIGVFAKQVKLIIADYPTTNQTGTEETYYGTIAANSGWASSDNYDGNQNLSSVGLYYWNNSTSTNIWSESNLNTVNLNQNYLNNIGSNWSDLIATTNWQVGGAASTNVISSPVQTVYNYEVGANTANTIYKAKIGLMYVSDYGYAASPENWSTSMGSLNTTTNVDNNWMYMGINEWTINRNSDNTSNVFDVSGRGSVSQTFAYTDPMGRLQGLSAVRPTFYLNSDVAYISGTGTQSDPFRIA